MSDSIRLQILKGMVTHFQAMNAEAGYTVDWSEVKLEPLKPNDRKKKAVMRVSPGTEEKKPLIGAGSRGILDCFLPITLDFYYLVDRAVDGGSTERAENILCEVQKWADLSNVNPHVLHSLALSVMELGNFVSVDDANDLQVDGSLTLMCRYRHKGGDPTVLK